MLCILYCRANKEGEGIKLHAEIDIYMISLKPKGLAPLSSSTTTYIVIYICNIFNNIIIH